MNELLLDNNSEIKQLIHVNLPIGLISRVDKYVEENIVHESRSSAVRELLKIGLWFAYKKKEFETIFKNPELMEELGTQLDEGGLVDYVQRMNLREFRVVYSIFENEAKTRKLKLS